MCVVQCTYSSTKYSHVEWNVLTSCEAYEGTLSVQLIPGIRNNYND